MGSTKSILRRIGTEDQRQELESERLKQNYEQIRINDDKLEEERNKDESTKAHERYRRKQKNSESAMSLEGLIKPAKKLVEKPGTYFHGPLKRLAEEFGDIKTMTSYMTIGQITKYTEKDGCLYNRKGEVVYREETQECFE
jgi:hypothetical protein